MPAASLLAFFTLSVVLVLTPGPSVLFTIGQALSYGRREALLTVLGNGIGVLVQGALVATGLGVLLQSVTGALAVMRLIGGCYLIYLGVQAIRTRRAAASPTTETGASGSAGGNPSAGGEFGAAGGEFGAAGGEFGAAGDERGTAGGALVGTEGDVATAHHRAEVDTSGRPTEATARRPAVAVLRRGLILGLSNPKSLVFLSTLLPQFVTDPSHAVRQMLLLALVFTGTALSGDSLWAVGAAAAREWFGRSRSRLPVMRAAGGVMMIGLGVFTLAGLRPQR